MVAPLSDTYYGNRGVRDALPSSSGGGVEGKDKQAVEVDGMEGLSTHSSARLRFGRDNRLAQVR